MQEELIAASSRCRAFVLAAALAALPAGAVVLGDLEVRSALGEALDARIPLSDLDGEAVDASCFSLAREGPSAVPVLGEGILTVERTGDAPALRIRSLARVYEPAVMLRVRAACPGESGYMLRQYSVLLDPPARREVVVAAPIVQAPAPAAAPSPEAPGGEPGRAPPPRVSAILNARAGDSLASIAAKVFPRDRQARARYLVALREANPVYAAQAEGDALPEGAPVALPDLRGFAVVQARRAPRPPRREAPDRSTASAPAQPPASRAPAAPPERAAGREAPGGGSGFVLRLSSAEVDLSRSRAIDDRMRAQLRERLLVLDADDQVAALLAMRDSLRQLENRVAELQLKLAAMPPSLAARVPAVEPEAGAGQSAAPPAPAQGAAAVTPSAPTAPAPSSAPPAQEPGTAAKPRPAPKGDFWRVQLEPWLWGLVALLAALAALLAWRLGRRATREPAYEFAEPPLDAGGEPPGPEAYEIAPERAAVATAPDAAAAPAHDQPAQLRRRYIEERFPEVASRTIVLDDPESVVKGARLFYEDGAVARAVELLHFAIDEDPAQVRPWLALFEIYRLENLPGEFAALAARFRERHGTGGNWRKVQYIGREMDPGNPLYDDESIQKLETIGPAAARRVAAATFDPVAENWLNAPMDFQNQVLANELRRALMAEAAITEQDLVPNPMPALRSAETFQLA